MKLKVCGMKYHENILALSELQPNYLGLIFYNQSKRNVTDTIPELPELIKKTGVFVNKEIKEIQKKIKEYQLQAIQLHGKESPTFCHELKTQNPTIEIIKAFSISAEFHFSVLEEYEKVCDYFLFDTKGQLPGGNGFTFDWTLLNHYQLSKPYFLSGGISLESTDKIKEFMKTKAAKHCYAIDINSGFETKPALKNLKKIKQFKAKIKSIQ